MFMNNSIFKSRFVAAILTGIVVLGTPLYIVAEDEDLTNQLDSIQQQVNQQNAKKADAETVIVSVSEQLRQIEEQLRQAQQQLDSIQQQRIAVENDITVNEKLLAEAQKRLEGREAVFYKRVRDIYINGRLSYLDVVIGSKDFTDFEEALMWVAKSYPQQKIHVLGAFGGRVDHAISCLWTMFRPELQALIPYLSLEDEWNHISFLIPGDYVIEKLNHTKYLSFITTSPIKQLSLKNVKYTLNNQDYDFPIALISNEFIEDKMEISFKSGGIIVGQTRDSWR